MTLFGDKDRDSNALSVVVGGMVAKLVDGVDVVVIVVAAVGLTDSSSASTQTGLSGNHKARNTNPTIMIDNRTRQISLAAYIKLQGSKIAFVFGQEFLAENVQ